MVVFKIWYSISSDLVTEGIDAAFDTRLFNKL